MNNINGIRNKLNSAQMQQAKLQEAKKAQARKGQAPDSEANVVSDRIELSKEAKQLSSAQEAYRRFLESKAEEVKEKAPEKVAKMKEQMAKTDGNDLPMDEVASKIAEDMFGA